MGRFRVLIAFTLSMFVLLAGVLVVLPVERAAADSVELGPDGYFSALEDTDGDGQILPVVDSETGTPGTQNANGWINTRRILFGKTDSSVTYGGASVSGGYKTLGVGGQYGIPSIEHITFFWTYDEDINRWEEVKASSSTGISENEALLWAEDRVTPAFAMSATPNSTFDDSGNIPPYMSTLASTGDGPGDDDVAGKNYSLLETAQLRNAAVEGVCTNFASSCVAHYDYQSSSDYEYRVFPLSFGDLVKYFRYPNIPKELPGTRQPGADTNLASPDCLADLGGCSPSEVNHQAFRGSWLRGSDWGSHNGLLLMGNGRLHSNTAASAVTNAGLRPAVRLDLKNLLLSAHEGNQSQVLAAVDSLSLTFVESGTKTTAWSVSVSGGAGSRVLDLRAASELGAQDAVGWKLVEQGESQTVKASGKTSAAAGGTVALPSDVSDSATYDLYLWGQESGSASKGWSNKASEPLHCTLTGDTVSCPKSPPLCGIELTGQTAGELKAYRIGDYAESVFDHTGALKTVRLGTPSGLGTVLKSAAESAGRLNVDAGNPIGWVAAQWLGYPADPLSDDVTSAFSPFAGKLQLFAQALEKDEALLGASAGSLPAGTFSSPTTETLVVPCTGLYLIVDDSGASLPIIVGTKVFNDALDDGDGRFVDFADAGVRGKPRLGRADLKTTVVDIAKRIVNDAGMDGFDVGAQVEYEIALRVPDLNGFSAVPYGSYQFDVADVAEAGLTLPAASEVRVWMDVPSPGTEVTATAGLSIAVSGDTLSVSGLKVLFANDNGASGVTNKVPAGSLIRLRYTAVLNTGASWSAPGGGGIKEGEYSVNENTATLTRSMGSGGTESKTASANAYSFRVDLLKVDKDDMSTALGDAKFEVSRDGQALKFTQVSAGVYRLDAAGGTEVTTHADGTLTLLGVEARELSFRETQAPDGYFTVSDFTVEVVPVWNADASEVTVVSYRTGGTNLAYVSQDGRSVTVADPSKSLANLPYTGGIGILLLLIIGGLFLMVAVRPYYLSHRAEATANILI
jgi:fimbrial isopeptide formation D2 family protein